MGSPDRVGRHRCTQKSACRVGEAVVRGVLSAWVVGQAGLGSVAHLKQLAGVPNPLATHPDPRSRRPAPRSYPGLGLTNSWQPGPTSRGIRVAASLPGRGESRVETCFDPEGTPKALTGADQPDQHHHAAETAKPPTPSPNETTHTRRPGVQAAWRPTHSRHGRTGRHYAGRIFRGRQLGLRNSVSGAVTASRQWVRWAVAWRR